MTLPLTLLAARRHVHLFAAGAVWSIVGGALAVVGAHWLTASDTHASASLLVLAAAAGWAKGHFLLAPRARANVTRILAANEGRPLTEVFSAASWMFVAGMMGVGYLLRHSAVPREVIGWIYATVGVALLTGSVVSWSAWTRARRELPNGDRDAPPSRGRA